MYRLVTTHSVTERCHCDADIQYNQLKIGRLYCIWMWNSSNSSRNGSISGSTVSGSCVGLLLVQR